MYAFFDKHGKKLLAIAAALLCVIFLLPPNIGRRGNENARVGTVNGRPIDAKLLDTYYRMLRDLEHVYVGEKGGQPESIVNLAFPGAIYRQITRDSGLTWYLLVTEATESGVLPGDDVVQQVADETLLADEPGAAPVPFKNLKDTAQKQIKDEIRLLLAVSESARRSMLTSKISQPLIDEEMASRFQQIRARAVVFDAADFASQVTPPTEEELRTQFEGFASTMAGDPNPQSNPFGFGYRVPDRLRVQYLAIPDAELERAVVDSMSRDAWEEQARFYYLTHKAEFAEKSPTSQPTSAPTSAPTSGPSISPTPAAPTAATKPATAPAASSQPVVPPFEAISEKVYQTVRKPLIEKQRQAIANKIRQQMAIDYQRASKDGANAGASKTSFGVALSSYEYLLKLRDEIQKQFKVTITVGGDGSLLSEQELRKLPGLGEATLESNSPMQMGMTSAASYIFENLKPLLPADQRNRPDVIDVNQLTPVFKGKDGLYMARVVEVAPSHAPTTLQEVRGQVEHDVMRRQAFGKAAEAAKAALESVRLSGLSTYKERPVYTSDWFGLVAQDSIPGFPPTVNTYADRLVAPIFNIQRGLKSTAELPKRDVIRLQPVDKVVLAEVFDIKSTLPASLAGMFRTQVASQLEGKFITPTAFLQWFSPEAVAARVGYVSPEHKTPTEPSEPAMPTGPAVPGM